MERGGRGVAKAGSKKESEQRDLRRVLERETAPIVYIIHRDKRKLPWV